MKHSRAFIKKQRARIQVSEQRRLQDFYQKATKKCYSRSKRIEREFNQVNKRYVLSFYGVNGDAVCVWCGFDDIRALSIDHIDDNGAEHRKEIGKGGTAFYAWLIKNNFPEGFQTLCMNCQFIKRQSQLGFEQ